MNQRDTARIVDLLLEVGGRTPWVLLWDDEDSVVSSVAPEDVAELVCSHLLRMLRHELSVPMVIASEH